MEIPTIRFVVAYFFNKTTINEVPAKKVGVNLA